MSLQPGGSTAFGTGLYDPAAAMAMNAQQRPMLAMNAGQQMLANQQFLQHNTQPMLVNGSMHSQAAQNQMFNVQQQQIIRRQQAMANAQAAAGMQQLMQVQPMPGTPQINGGAVMNQMRRPVSMIQGAQMASMQVPGMTAQMASQMGNQAMYRAGVNPAALAGRVPQHMQPELAQQFMINRQSMGANMGLSPATMQQQRSVSAPHMPGQMQAPIGVPQAMPMPPQVHNGHHQPAQYAQQHASLPNGMQGGPQNQPPLNTANAPPTVPSAPPGPAGPGGLVRRTPDPSFTAAANLQAQHQHLQQQAQYAAVGRPGTPQQPQMSPVRPPTVANMHPHQGSPPQDHFPQQQQPQHVQPGQPNRAPSVTNAQVFHQTPAQVLSATNGGSMQDVAPPDAFPPALVPSSQPQQHPQHPQAHYIMQNGQPAMQHDQPGAMRPGQPQLARQQQVNMVPANMAQMQRQYAGQPISQASYMQRAMSMNPPPQPQPIAVGSGIMRLFNFSTAMSREGPERYKHEYWTNAINQSFAAGAVFKLTLWKDNIAAEAKPFELGLATLPRFFLVTSQSGVKSMTLTAEGAVERLGRAPNGAPNMTLDCAHATWTCRYTSGYTVTLRGPISASMSLAPTDSVLRFDSVTFEAKHHEKHIIVDAIGRNGCTPKGATPATLHSSPSNSNTAKTDDSLETKTGLTPDDRTTIIDPSLPPDPVNGFGVPQATMRCLELAESVNVMEGLIQFADGMDSYSPMESLRSFAEKIRGSNRTAPGGHSNTSPPQPHTVPATPQQQPTPAPSGTHSTPHLSHATTQHGSDGSSSGTNTLQSALVIQTSPPRPPPVAAPPPAANTTAPPPPAAVPAPAPVAPSGKRKNAPADGISTSEPPTKRVARRNSRRGGG